MLIWESNPLQSSSYTESQWLHFFFYSKYTKLSDWVFQRVNERQAQTDGLLVYKAVEPVSPPFGQRKCPEMDSCAQGRAYRKWNHTQYLWLPRGVETHWPGHPAADRQADSWPSKVFTRSATIHRSLKLQNSIGLKALFCLTNLHFLFLTSRTKHTAVDGVSDMLF